MRINLPNSQHSKNPIHILKWVPTNKIYKKKIFNILKTLTSPTSPPFEN
jgi:hypothetical protein